MVKHLGQLSSYVFFAHLFTLFQAIHAQQPSEPEIEVNLASFANPYILCGRKSFEVASIIWNR